MVVRETMQAVIDRLRLMTAASRTDEYQGVLYWSDQQLQDVLDQSRVGVPVRVQLQPGTDKVDGETQWNVMTAPLYKHLAYEDSPPVFTESGVQVSAENVAVVSYGTALQVTLSDEPQKDYWVELTVYNMNWAAAEVWGRKASQRQDMVSMRMGQHAFRGDQTPDFCLKREAYFRSKAIRVFDTPEKQRFVPVTRSTRWGRRW